MQLTSYTFGFADNSAGKQAFYQLDSFNKESILFASPSEHKQQVINWFEQKTKLFLLNGLMLKNSLYA